MSADSSASLVTPTAGTAGRWGPSSLDCASSRTPGSADTRHRHGLDGSVGPHRADLELVLRPPHLLDGPPRVRRSLRGDAGTPVNQTSFERARSAASPPNSEAGTLTRGVLSSAGVTGGGGDDDHHEIRAGRRAPASSTPRYASLGEPPNPYSATSPDHGARRRAATPRCRPGC